MIAMGSKDNLAEKDGKWHVLGPLAPAKARLARATLQSSSRTCIIFVQPDYGIKWPGA